MGDQAILDLGRADTIAGRTDHVVVAAQEMQPAVRVLAAPVAGQQPAPLGPGDEFLFRRLRIVPIAQKHHRIGGLHGDGAFGFRRQQGAGHGIDDLDPVAGHGAAHRTGQRRFQRGAARHRHVAFRLAVEFVDGGAEHGFAPADQFLAQRFTAAGDRAQVQTVTFRARHLLHDLQRRRRQEDVADPVGLHQVEGGLGGELGKAAGDHGDAVVQGGHQHVQKAADPGPVGGGPEPVARMRQEVVADLDPRQMRQQDPVGMQRPLWVAGGARRIDQDRRIVGKGRVNVEFHPLRVAEIVEGERVFAAIDRDHELQVRQAVTDSGQLCSTFTVSDDGTGAGIAQPVQQRVFPEQGEQRDRHAAHLVDRDMGRRCFERLRQQHANPVADLALPRDAKRGQRVGQLVRPALQVQETVFAAGPVRADIDDGQPVRVAFGPFVADIIAHVVSFRDVPDKTAIDLVMGFPWLQHPILLGCGNYTTGRPVAQVAGRKQGLLFRG